MKALTSILVVLFGSLLVYGAMEFPPWGAPWSPASTHVSPRYIERAFEETTVPNMVTAVLADYRGYDTMFETIVIFTAGVICIFLLRTFKPADPESRLYRHIHTGITLRIKRGAKFPDDSSEFERIDTTWTPYALIVKTTCRLIIPFIQIFSLYVITHGHHSPGGGFQGGVIFGASLVLFALAYDLRSALKRMGEKLIACLCTLGVFIYAGTGMLGMLYQGNYLDYGVLAPIFGTSEAQARSHGILLVEIGVGMAVMAVMVILYYNLVSRGKQDEGL